MQQTFGKGNRMIIFAAENKTTNQNMLIIDVKDSESIDKALKKYKRKFEKAGILKELRRRQVFQKPSISRRATVIRAAYREEVLRKME